MRFIHTADWHLGRIFHNQHLTDDQAYLLEEFIRLAKDVRPDAVIIAGDIYDRAVPPPDAVSLLDEVLYRLAVECGATVLLIAGNHDSPERIGFGDRLLARQKIHLAGRVVARQQPVELSDQYGKVYFCPLPYAEPPLVRERLGVEAYTHDEAMQALLADAEAGLPAGVRRVAVGHAFVAGGTASESERPLSVGTVSAVSPVIFQGFHYVALGHLHKPQAIGQDHIRYSGSLLKYSFSEADHHKSVAVVDLDQAGAARVEAVSLAPRRDVRILTGCMDELLRQGETDPVADDYIAVVLKDTGPILDGIGKLRRVYPNVLQLERSILTAGQWRQDRKDHRRQTDEELFTAFFRQVTGQDMETAEREAVRNVLADFRRREREAEV